MSDDLLKSVREPGRYFRCFECDALSGVSGNFDIYLEDTECDECGGIEGTIVKLVAITHDSQRTSEYFHRRLNMLEIDENDEAALSELNLFQRFPHGVVTA